MNSYEAKQEARRQRLERAAERAESRSDAAHRRVKSIADHIPLGQPILVGHHSERHARRDAERIHNGMRKAVDESKRADDLARRAAAVGTGGVSSDDPEAVDKLRARLAEMETERDVKKRANAAYKRGGWDAVRAVAGEKLTASGMHTLALTPYHKHPFPRYELTNLGASIRRIQARIAALQASAARVAAEPVEINGIRIEERAEINRVALVFPAKPSDAVRARLKSYGFRWSRTEGAWLRHLNSAGTAAAKAVAQTCTPAPECSKSPSGFHVEDNQGLCHYGCGAVMNESSYREYFGTEPPAGARA